MKWGPRTFKSVAVIVVVTAISIVITATEKPGPVGASTRTLSWLAAGDSYASGAGLPNTTSPCAQGTGVDGYSSTWATVAARRLNDEATRTHLSFATPDLVACTGATSSEFFNAQNGNGPQWNPSMGRFNLVSFSFGGDDIGFTGIVERCLVHLCPSNASVREKIASLNSTRIINGESVPPYSSFLARVANSAVSRGGDVVVMGYPELFEDPSLNPSVIRCSGFTTGEMATVRGWAGDLNATIGNAVTQVNSLPASQRNDVHFTFIDSVTGQSSDGISLSNPFLYEPSVGIRHELCSSGNQSWLNGLSLSHPTRSFHPNQLGENALGDLAAEVVQSLTFSAPVVTTTTTSTTSPSNFGFAAGDRFDNLCVVAWPTAPVITETQIVLTMSCQNVPETEFLFTQVQYGDPSLAITPDTGTVRVIGKVLGVATSDFGFKELVIAASSITL